MSSRVTRSSSKKSANSANRAPSADLATTTSLPQPVHQETEPASTFKKRKHPSKEKIESSATEDPPPPKAKRAKKSHSGRDTDQDIPKTSTTATGKKSARKKSISNMTSPTEKTTLKNEENEGVPADVGSASKRKSSKPKKTVTPPDPGTGSSTKPRSKKRGSASNKEDAAVKPPKPEKKHAGSSSQENTSSEPSPRNEQGSDSIEEDAFAGAALFGLGGFRGLGRFHPGLHGHFMGAPSGFGAEMRSMIEGIKQHDSPDLQYESLLKLSQTLLIANDDVLTGQFDPNQLVRELINLMQPGESGESNFEMELLACRCIYNLIEAFHQSMAIVVYTGAVPVLISKLVTIEFMDLAEQALTTLQKISAEFPAAIVREGGLTACLQFLDFFPTGVQRTAVTTAANCCRSVPSESFEIVKEVMPNLLNVLNSNDQKVVEQGSLCITRIVDSFRYQDEKLEQLMNADLLKVILRLLLPGTTNFISGHIHTQFLRLLAVTARASPSLTKDLFKMNITDTLFQILTGVSPPSDEEGAASKIDSVMVMQALIHRPRDQVYETLNVICELLPGINRTQLAFVDELSELQQKYQSTAPTPQSSENPINKRRELLEECKDEVKRFAIVLLPTLTDAYSSTVNFNVRLRVLTAQLKMLSNLDSHILEEALRPVPYASYLASILSQQDHPYLVIASLQAAELLIQRLGRIYQYQFCREGVIAEVWTLAKRPPLTDADQQAVTQSPQTSPNAGENRAPTADNQTADADASPTAQETGPEAEGEADEGENHSGDDEDAVEEVEVEELDDGHDEDSEASSEGPNVNDYPTPSALRTQIHNMVTKCAREFISRYQSTTATELRSKAERRLETLNRLVSEIRDAYDSGLTDDGAKFFTELSKAFEGDALESITSYELLSSKIAHTLVDVFDVARGESNVDARVAFAEAFMGSTLSTGAKSLGTNSTNTPFSVLVQKLQDLLSRAEHFEVLTIQSSPQDNARNLSTASLSKQIRIRLVADGEEANIPPQFQTIMVSIHAIANLKALEDYLRPRFILDEVQASARKARHDREAASRSAAAAAATSHDSPESLFSRRQASTAAAPGAPKQASPARSTSARRASKSATDSPTTVADATDVSKTTSTPRRSIRKTKSQPDQPSTPSDPPSSEARGGTNEGQNPLECADEAQLPEDADLDAHADSLGSSDNEVTAADEAGASEPPAVNMEVAPSGRVTARKDDGTTVTTPMRGGASNEPASTPAAPAPPSLGSIPRSLLAGALPGGARSYAAAVQSTPTDWHLEFSINERRIPGDMTIYKAVHSNTGAGGAADPANRNIWNNTHVIRYKRVQGAPPADGPLALQPAIPPNQATNQAQPPAANPTAASNQTSSLGNNPTTTSNLPQSLQNNPTTAVILKLLRILHEINRSLNELLGERQKVARLQPELLSQFVNTKLTAKMNRQLEEPLIVASKSLPTWSEDLAHLYPFLFPFETRHLYLQSTAFGYSRSIGRWQSASQADDSRRRSDRPQLARPQRQKVRIQRSRFLDSVVKVVDLYAHSQAILEVEYYEEVGTGLGPTLEFYATASKEFSKKKTSMWRENESNNKNEYAFGKAGLFPAPMDEKQASDPEGGERVLGLFRALGKFVARSMLDSRIIDISFNPTFFRVGMGESGMPPNLATLKTVDEDLGNSLSMLKQFDVARKKILQQQRLSPEQKHQKLSLIRVANARIEDLGLDFTLPGYPAVELVPGGANQAVTLDNVGAYVDAVMDMTLNTGVIRQINAFRAGFSKVFAYTALRTFTADELVMLFGRVDEDWSLETLVDSIKVDHGFNLDSPSVRNLLSIMTGFSPQRRRDFLQFVTGSPKLPIGGFKSLTPMFTVVHRRADAGQSPDDYLPSCMTCANYLKLPDYSTLDIMKKKLGIAIREGQGAFHLS